MDIKKTELAREKIMNLPLSYDEITRLIRVRSMDIEAYWRTLSRYLSVGVDQKFAPHMPPVGADHYYKLDCRFRITTGNQFVTMIGTDAAGVIRPIGIPGPNTPLNDYVIIQAAALAPIQYAVSSMNEIVFKPYLFGLVDPLILNLFISRNLLHKIVDALYAIRDEDLRNAIMGLMKLSLTEDPIVGELFRDYIFSEKVTDPRNNIVNDANLVFVEISNQNTKYCIDYRLLHRFNYP